MEPLARPNVLPNQEMIDRLAERIERAFLRRYGSWNRGCSTSRVWSAAAHNLWQVHEESPELPLDPELYVASQSVSSRFSDPWTNLTGAEAKRRFAQHVRKIVRLLHSELSQEVAIADRLMAKGIDITRIVRSRKLRLSALGCYIVVLRAGRGDLAADFHGQALEQHRSCPLYRIACSSFLPEGYYPDEEYEARRPSPSPAFNPCVCDSLTN